MATGKIKQPLHFGSVTDVYWWDNSWTAPSDGMMMIKIVPNANSNWNFYVTDSTITSIAGSWGHCFSGTTNLASSHCIPIKKGAVLSTASIDNISSIKCIFYPLQ